MSDSPAGRQPGRRVQGDGVEPLGQRTEIQVPDLGVARLLLRADLTAMDEDDGLAAPGLVIVGVDPVDLGLQPPAQRPEVKVGNEPAGHVNFAAVVQIAAAYRGADRQPIRARQRD